LRAIHDYIAADSPRSATRLVDRITRKTDSLGRFPLSGHSVPEYEVESVRQVLEGNYRIIYRVTPNRVEVIAVIHGARELPSLDSLS
jgi:plasmid stabilization system protein ParE